MHLINALRYALGLPPAGEPIPRKEGGFYSRSQQSRKEKSRAANKRASRERRRQNLSAR